jgi:sec-independent protein translocase protein TatA
MPFGIGFPELIILLVVLLLVFGAKRLPEMGRSLGKGMREFKDGVSGLETNVTDSEAASPPAELPSTTAQPNPAQIARDLQSLSDEDKQAIVDALKSSEEPSGAQSERETVS